MGGVPSTPRLGGGARPQETAEYLIGEFVGEKSFPLTSDYWQKLLELPLDLRWESDRARQACHLFATNNSTTRHLAKILIHLAWCLQECISSSGVPTTAFSKASNALFMSSVFLKFLIENAKSENFKELFLSLDETEPIPNRFSEGVDVTNLIMYSVLRFVGKVDVSPETYLLHHDVLNFLLTAMSTQLLSGPSPGPSDVHPFIDAAMVQETSIVNLVVRKLLLNYITFPRFPGTSLSYTMFSEGNQLGVLRRVGSAAGTFLKQFIVDSCIQTSIVNLVVRKLLLNYITFPRFPGTSLSYTMFSEGNQLGVLRRVGSAAAHLMLLPLNFLVGSTGEASKRPLAEFSLNVLLVLVHYRKFISMDYVVDKTNNSSSESLRKEGTNFSENPFCKAVENVRDIQFDRNDVEGNAHGGLNVRLTFASLFDILCTCLAEETSVLLLYSLVHGNSGFLEYVLVRTDLDTLLMPMLETLYNAPRRSSNHIYMVLIIFLILSQDSSFNASIHKLMLPNVPWYQERLLHQTSLGSLMVIILIRTVKYNLSKLRDVYLHTNCLATLANMAPHVHRLSAYASQRLVSLFYMLSRKYNKLAEIKNDKMNVADDDLSGDTVAEDPSAELHIYTDFLRLVLEILNAILTYALPRNPEVIYAIMHRQEVFLPFKNHPRFNELLENIYTVLDFFNSRIDAQQRDGEWSVEKVLQVIVNNCRSWRGEGMKIFTQLRFTYEQESHPEEFFIPYVWQLVLSQSDFTFNSSCINLFSVDQPVEEMFDEQDMEKFENGEAKELTFEDKNPV